jgi:hypothetical protein
VSDDLVGEQGDDPVAQYRETLAGGVRELLAGGYVRATTDALLTEMAALEALGGIFATYGDRHDDNIERIGDAAVRLTERAGVEPGAGADDKWIADSLLTDLHNLHISVDSNLARSGFAGTASWALEGMADMHAVQLMERIGPALSQAIESEWVVWAGAQEISTTIETLCALPRPDGLDDRSLHPSELPEWERQISEAYGRLESVVPGDEGDDESLRAAEWLQFPTDGLTGARGHRQDAAAASSGGAAEATASTTLTIDWSEVHSVNRATCKAASNDQLLEFWAWGYLVLIGDDHNDVLMNAVRSQPDVARGTMMYVSASFGPGHIQVLGCPPELRPQFEWAMGQFSQKEVRFLAEGSAGGEEADALAWDQIDWDVVQGWNEGVLKATQEVGTTVQFVQDKVFPKRIVFGGDLESGPLARYMDALVARDEADKLAGGTITVTARGGVTSRGSIAVKGATDQDAFKETIRVFTKKQLTFV